MEKGLYSAKSKFPVEVKISNRVIHAEMLFYFTISLFSMSATFRRAVGVHISISF